MDTDSKRDWIAIPHYFRNPLYRVNYLYARLLALKYYELYKRDPNAFVPRYLALIRNGYDSPPDMLLKRFLDLDMRESRFVPGVLAAHRYFSIVMSGVPTTTSIVQSSPVPPRPPPLPGPSGRGRRITIPART
jgi:hypothetical protein